MPIRSSAPHTILASIAMSICFLLAISLTFAQQRAPRDPAEPQQAQPHPKPLPRPIGAIARQSIDVKSMRALIDQLVSCGTRLSLSSWTDPKRGIAASAAAAITSSPASTKSPKPPAASSKSSSTNSIPPVSALPASRSLWKASTPSSPAPTPSSQKHSSSSPATTIRVHPT